MRPFLVSPARFFFQNPCLSRAVICCWPSPAVILGFWPFWGSHDHIFIRSKTTYVFWTGASSPTRRVSMYNCIDLIRAHYIHSFPALMTATLRLSADESCRRRTNGECQPRNAQESWLRTLENLEYPKSIVVLLCPKKSLVILERVYRMYFLYGILSSAFSRCGRSIRTAITRTVTHHINHKRRQSSHWNCDGSRHHINKNNNRTERFRNHVNSHAYGGFFRWRNDESESRCYVVLRLVIPPTKGPVFDALN
jgi:hypothetical protein